MRWASFLIPIPSILLAVDAPQSPQSSSCTTNLEELRAKYAWGEICLTFSALSDLATLLKSQPRMQEIVAQNSESAVRAFAAHLVANIKKGNEGIGMLIIDLNGQPPRAGWKRAEEMTGVIEQLAWSGADVVCIANLCDQYLSGRLQWQEAKKRIATADSIREAWTIFQQINNAPYISPSAVGSLKLDVNQFVETHPDELRTLERKDQALFAAVKGFADNFDESSKVLVATVTAVDKENQTITASEGRNSAPVTLAYSDKGTAFVNIKGAKKSVESVSVGTPVGIYYATGGDERATRTLAIGHAGVSTRTLSAIAERPPTTTSF
jgi:hypothetical protein